MSSQNSTKLTDAMKEKFPSTLEGEKLVAGIYHVKGFELVPSEKYQMVAYLDTVEGKFRTTSASIVGSLAHSAGETIKELLQDHDNVEIEIIPKQANTGRWGIALKAF